MDYFIQCGDSWPQCLVMDDFCIYMFAMHSEFVQTCVWYGVRSGGLLERTSREGESEHCIGVTQNVLDEHNVSGYACVVCNNWQAQVDSSRT